MKRSIEKIAFILLSVIASAPAIALSFALRKSKEVRQKLVNAKSTEELEQKLDEIADALAITDS